MFDGFLDNAKTFWSWLPTVTGAIGGILGAAYYVVQLYESRTFQHWKNNFLMKRRARKLAKLKARELVITAQIAALEKIRAARREARSMVADASAEAAKMLNHETTNIEVVDVVDKITNGDPGTKPESNSSP